MSSPGRNKNYEANSFYHCYNRGVDRMVIFKDKQDFQVFLYYLKIIFSPIPALEKELKELTEKMPWKDSALLKSFNHAYRKSISTRLPEQIELLNFSLMFNHFHLQIYQKTERAIEEVMRRLGTAYSIYFNRKYQRIGPLFQGRYKASHLYVDPPLQSLLIGRYIENNPHNVLHTTGQKSLHQYPYSSYQFYFKKIKQKKEPPAWLKMNRLLRSFVTFKRKPNSPFESMIAKHPDFLHFIEQNEGLSLEDVRLAYLDELESW